MSKRTVAEVLVDELAEAGVTRLYGLVGDSLNPVSDALRRDGRIRFIHVRHEETAASPPEPKPSFPKNSRPARGRAAQGTSTSSTACTTPTGAMPRSSP